MQKMNTVITENYLVLLNCYHNLGLEKSRVFYDHNNPKKKKQRDGMSCKLTCRNVKDK